MRLASLALSLALLPSCTRASLLVCREVTDRGVCRQPTTVLDVGHEYAVLATGFGLPHGRVTMRLHETVAGVERQVAEADFTIPDGSERTVRPLTLPHVGDYRLELLDEDGDRFRSVRLRAPRPTFHVTAPPIPPSRLPSPPTRPAAPPTPPAP